MVYKVKITPYIPLGMDLFSLQMVRVTERNRKKVIGGSQDPLGRAHLIRPATGTLRKTSVMSLPDISEKGP